MDSVDHCVANMTGKNQPKAQEVLLEDQERINQFNRYHTKMRELEATLKEHKRVLEEFEDAGNELMLSDDENVRFVVGECLVHYDKDTAEERLGAHTARVQKEVVELGVELEDVKEKIKKLKAVLYAKFGSSINLDE